MNPNYAGHIKASRHDVSEMTQPELQAMLVTLLSNRQIARIVGNLLTKAGEKQIQDNLVFTFNESLMNAGVERKSTDTNLMLLEAIKVGQIVSELVSNIDIKNFTENYNQSR